MQKEIQDLQNQLRVQERTLSPEAATDLRRQIDAKTKEFNRQGEDTQEEFQKKESELVNRIGQKMLRVIDRYAQDNGYTVILDVSSPQTPVLYAAMSVDITSDIVKLYDVTYKVEAPAATTPPASKPAARPAQPPAEAKKPSPPPSRP
jgi:outer membrane protein